MINIFKLYNDGIDHLQRENTEHEKEKRGVLRGGNSGIMTEKGKVYGSCHRRTALRSAGIEVDPPESNRELMFAAGRSNEDIWADKMARSWCQLHPDNAIKQEEEISTYWETANGIPVTGRPDVVLGKTVDDEFVAEVGLELKLVSSIWTARDVLFECRPKFAHLCQAAHYSWQLGMLPFQLYYTNRCDWAVNDMVSRLIPKMDSGHSDIKYVEYKPYIWTISKAGNGYQKRLEWDQYDPSNPDMNTAPLKILPFNIGYILTWESDGYLSYVRADRPDDKTVTKINVDSIRRYYDFIAEMPATDQLGQMPETVKGDGSKAGYSMCGYCPIQPICDGYKKHKNNSYNQWLEDVQQFMQEKDLTDSAE